MFHTIEEFVAAWQGLTTGTQQLMDAMTDPSLDQPVADDHRTLGRVAWHIVQTIPEMLLNTGLRAEGPAEDAPVPASAQAIADAYRATSASLLEQIQNEWTDASLEVEDDLYGQKWKRGYTLTALLHHEIHHRGQMSVLLRQAGIRVPGTYGPAKEDWASMNMEAPAI